MLICSAWVSVSRNAYTIPAYESSTDAVTRAEHCPRMHDSQYEQLGGTSWQHQASKPSTSSSSALCKIGSDGRESEVWQRVFSEMNYVMAVMAALGRRCAVHGVRRPTRTKVGGSDHLLWRSRKRHVMMGIWQDYGSVCACGCGCGCGCLIYTYKHDTNTPSQAHQAESFVQFQSCNSLLNIIFT